jgi:ornithine cyclodeaminase/alanine dehydrogenase-like protein (mu-crystallin family)
VSSVGYYPPAGELPPALASSGRLFVESLDALAVPPVGCGELKGVGASGVTTLGAVANDPRLGRTNAAEVTVYKAMGIAMEDLVAADLAYRRARNTGSGLQIGL